MAITMDGHPITSLLLKASNGATVTKQLVETGGATVDDWDIYNKELVDTWGGTLNLANDTNFDSLTPSTSTQYIIANNKSDKTLAVDLTNYRYMILREQYYKAAYAGTPADKAFAKRVEIQAFFLLRNFQGNMFIRTMLSSMTYQYNANGELALASNGQSYGLYNFDSSDNPSFASSSNPSTDVTIGMPSWMMRGSTSYSPVDTLEAIDSANSKIEYRYRLYRMPVNTLSGSAFNEAQYIVSNDGLRSLSSSD